MFCDGTAAGRRTACVLALTLALLQSAGARADAPVQPPLASDLPAGQEPPPPPDPAPPPPPPDPAPPGPPDPAPPTPPPPAAPEPTTETPTAASVPAAVPGPEAPAAAPSSATVRASDAEPEEEEEQPPLRLPFTLQTSVGQGSFVADPYARNAYFAYSLTFAPTYAPHEDVSVGLTVAMSQELTDSDIDTEQHQLLLSDTRLHGGYAFGQIPEVEIDVSGQARLFLPSSLASQHQTLVLGTGIALSLARKLGPVALGLSTSFRKNFHRYTTPVLDGAQGIPFVNARAGSAEVVEDGLAQGGTNNVSHSIAGELSVRYSPIEPLSFGIAYGLSTGFTYRSVPLDELSGSYAEEGVGQRDLSSGTISAGYELNERFSFGAGVSTVGPPLTADNQGPRFPFWDFESEADNLTTFYVDVTFTESLGK
jgi:hypothetical protein